MSIMTTQGAHASRRCVWSLAVLEALAHDRDQDIEKLFSQESARAWFEQRVQCAGSSHNFGDATMTGNSLDFDLGDTALHLAARNGKEMSTLCLIANGLRVDSVNCAGKTPPEVSSSDVLRTHFQIGSLTPIKSTAPKISPEAVSEAVLRKSCDTGNDTRMFGDIERISQVPLQPL